MRAANGNRERRETVVLTRQAIEAILVSYMGWEPEDADAFWELAIRETTPRDLGEDEMWHRNFERAFR
ncbi:hypothetical protein [Stappia indica]|uniref:hypothetical protein n=1 Tax=Stappia indica TaxID=538381 RepID=UPI00114622A5|nr:hypothetical protein [Stappia indica]